MNIVRIVFNKKILGSVLVFIAMLGAVRYTISPDQFMIVCDQRIAVDAQYEIKRAIMGAPPHMQRANMLCSELQTLCPAVSDISIAYKSSLRAVVLVRSYQPSIIIRSAVTSDKEYVLCHDKRFEEPIIIDKKYFSEHCIKDTAVFSIDDNFEEKRADKAFIRCAETVSQELFSEFSVMWHSKSEITLKHHELPIMIIADAQAIHETEKRAAVKRIYEAEPEKYKDGLRADIRLRESVICAPLKGN